LQLKIIGKNVEITKEIEDYVRKKVDRLFRYLPDIDDAKVEINAENVKSHDHRFTTQVTVKSRGTLLRSEERGANVNSAIDAATEILARQIRRYKGKFSKKGRGISRTQQIATSETTVGDKAAKVVPQVVRVKQFAVKSMLVDEAAEQMELLGHDFFLFISSDTGSLKLIYRRKDGNYGVIEPVLA